ncbi:MAG TPA: MaoC family dehydratase N-terminal domain-containing protein [Amycolatopsis sp.]|nr:MaoC family dehydratase N-terminal domain-containing protein [Amycolatopsis sp.]
MSDRELPADYGKITPESIDRMRGRIGVRQPGIPAWYTEAHHDTMRHFAWSFGDDNPLFADPEYGKETRWGSIIGSPFYVANLHQPVAPPIPPEVRAKTRGALAGLHEFHAGSEFRFYRPVVPGDQAFSARWITDVEEQASTFGGGRSVVRNMVEYIEAADGSPIQQERMWFIHTERESARKSGSEKAKTPKAAYSPEEIEAIESEILAEQRRGGEARYWEDVRVGDSVGHLTKGPMTVTDMIAGHIGRGPGHYAWGPLELATRGRRRHPGFYTRNEFGGWDVTQRVHWDAEYARSIGAAERYDYGTMRLNWLGHLLTNWMGDDGWITRLRCEFRKFNYVGDVSRLTGSVTGKNDDGTVEVTISCVNQRGEDTCPANATIALPTRAQGNPALPRCDDWEAVR